MALAREEINLEHIKRDEEIEVLVNSVVRTDIAIAHLKDEQLEMRNEIKRRDEIISNIEDDIRKDKRWNMLWCNSLNEDVNHTKLLVFVVGGINVLFTYFMSR